MWQYLAERLGVEIKYVYYSAEDYASALAGGNLTDIATTQNNLSTIMENGVAFDADPYLRRYMPNLFKGDALLTYDVFKKLSDGGFYFFPAKIGYNGVGYDNESGTCGYTVRWDYYKELGYRCPFGHLLFGIYDLVGLARLIVPENAARELRR